MHVKDRRRDWRLESSLQVRQQGRPRLRAARLYRLPINPNEADVEGLPTYASVLDVPGPIDMATVYVQPDVGVGVMDELAKKGVRKSGSTRGPTTDEVVDRARALGLKTIQACSIIAMGDSPSRY